MQNEPKKIFGNYNEFVGVREPGDTSENNLELHTEQQEIIETGLRLVHNKIDDILGASNELTNGDLVLPEIVFIENEPEYPSWAGYFCSYRNKIAVITGNVKGRIGQTKVFIHEYLHFMSHNGRDDSEQVAEGSSIASSNNVGFRRNFGLDIRRGKEGQTTSDYFLAFNEAVTEQLAIDIFPGAPETYGDYLGLLNQVIDDAVAQKLGSDNPSGEFEPWSRDQVKGYIYRCFFMGDLNGFTQLLQTTYQTYNISEQQFGLMTNRDDLPTVIESKLSKPGSPPPPPDQVAAMVQDRLDRKTSTDYQTDVLDTEPDDDNNRAQVKYGTEYDTYIQENKIEYSHNVTVGGKKYQVDNHGHIIYSGEEAVFIFQAIKKELDDLLATVDSGGADATSIARHMDELLFHAYSISMLSDGFRDFYIYKHTKIDSLEAV